MRGDPGGSWYLTGAYGNGKTHLLYAQYRRMVLDGKSRFHVRTTRELVEELRRAKQCRTALHPETRTHTASQ